MMTDNITTDDVIDAATRRVLTVRINRWAQSANAADYFTGYTPENTELAMCWLNKDVWAKPLVGREGVTVLVRTYREMSTENSIRRWKADLVPIDSQTDEVKRLLGFVEPAEPPSKPAPKAQGNAKPKVRTTSQAGARRAQPGHTKAPAEKNDPTKDTMVHPSMAAAERLHSLAIKFTDSTGVGKSEFLAMAAMEGALAVMEKYGVK